MLHIAQSMHVLWGNCYEDELQKHIKKCNITKSQQAIEKLPYYVKDVNKGTKHEGKNESASTLGSVKDLTSKRLGAMIEKVHRLYSDVVEDIEKLYLEHPCVKEEIIGNLHEDLNRAFGDQAVLRKEMLQQASLVGQLENLGFLTSGYHYVELGAGKGKLSHWIQKASKDCVDNSFLLVERSSVRYKVDPYHKHRYDEDRKVDFQRVKIDIKDFYLGKVPEILNKESVVVVGKHLCGGATDLGIRCAVNTLYPYCSSDSAHQQKPSQLMPSPNMSLDSNKSHKDESVTKKNEHAGLERECSKSEPSDDSPLLQTSPEIVSSHPTLPERNSSHHTPPERNIQPLITNEQRCENKSVTAERKEEEATGKRDHSKLEPNQDPEQGNEDLHNVVGKSQSHSGEELNVEPPSKIARRFEEGVKDKCNLVGIMIALCCHHQCTWDTYVGQDFMRKHGVNEEEFDLLTRLSSWATCARTRIRGKTSSKKSADVEDKLCNKSDDSKSSASQDTPGQETKEKEEEDEHSVEDLIGAATGDEIHLREKLSISEREKIGRKAKRIIDAGRLEYLQSKNMKCSLREYISDDFTPENVVLVATACERS